MEAKSIFKSKTFWTAVIGAVLSLEPVVQEFVKSNPSPAVMIIFTVMGFLRTITKDPVTLGVSVAKKDDSASREAVGK